MRACRPAESTALAMPGWDVARDRAWDRIRIKASCPHGRLVRASEVGLDPTPRLAQLPARRHPPQSDRHRLTWRRWSSRARIVRLPAGAPSENTWTHTRSKRRQASAKHAIAATRRLEKPRSARNSTKRRPPMPRRSPSAHGFFRRKKGARTSSARRCSRRWRRRTTPRRSPATPREASRRSAFWTMIAALAATAGVLVNAAIALGWLDWLKHAGH